MPEVILVKKNYSKIKGVAEKLAMALLESGLTQAEVAKKLGVFPTAISRWKTGVTEPTPSNLNALAKVLNVDVHWLITDNGILTKSDQRKDSGRNTIVEEETIMWKDKFIEQIELNQKLLLEVGELKDQLLAKRPVPSTKKKKAG